MPSSAIQGKQEIKEWVLCQSDIETIIDVGAGSGTYRVLIGGGYKWIGIEIFSLYIEKFGLLDVYNEILIGNVYEFANGVIEGGLPEGDLIIFGDILEHLEKEQALFTLDKALEKYKHVIVSIPVDSSPGKIHYGNPYEAHISNWDYMELVKIAPWEKTLQSKGIGVFIK